MFHLRDFSAHIGFAGDWGGLRDSCPIREDGDLVRKAHTNMLPFLTKLQFAHTLLALTRTLWHGGIILYCCCSPHCLPSSPCQSPPLWVPFCFHFTCWSRFAVRANVWCLSFATHHSLLSFPSDLFFPHQCLSLLSCHRCVHVCAHVCKSRVSERAHSACLFEPVCST